MDVRLGGHRSRNHDRFESESSRPFGLFGRPFQRALHGQNRRPEQALRGVGTELAEPVVIDADGRALIGGVGNAVEHQTPLAGIDDFRPQMVQILVFEPLVRV